MTIEQIEARLAELRTAIDADGADLNAIEEETTRLLAERAQLRADAEARARIRDQIAAGAGDTTEAHEETAAEPEDVRSSAAYVEAYARYIRTGDPRECRALLTENATNGTVPVPTIVDSVVRTAWDNDPILSRVRKTDFAGNVKVPFEISSSEAVEHVEGSGAIDEESLVLGIVNMEPKNIKKFIRLSDETVAMGGEAFVRYIYEELTYRIIRKLAALVVTDIAGAPVNSTASAVGIPKVEVAPSLIAVPTASAYLSDEAVNPVVIMNRLTKKEFTAAYAAGSFAVDPFEGMTVIYSNALKAYSEAGSGETYAIVGDLNGAQVNYPQGEGIVFKYDDLSEAEADLVKVVGRQYAAHAVTAPGRFARLTKA